MLDAGPPVEFLILSSHDVMCLTNNIVSNTQTSTIEWYRIVFLPKKLKNTQQCSFRALAAGKIIELQDFWCHIQIPHPQISIKRDQACLYMKIWYFLNMDKYGFLPFICSIQGPPVEILISSSYSVYFFHLRRP